MSTSLTSQIRTAGEPGAVVRRQAVESHQPLPAHQQLSSGFELRRKVRTLLESPRLNAADNFCAVSSSRAPKQGTNIAAQTNRASKWSVPVRVTRIHASRTGHSSGPSAGVRGSRRSLAMSSNWTIKRFQALATDSFRMRGNPYYRTCNRLNGWSERRIAKYHSYRSATIGSTWEARRAGRKPASAATRASRVAANRMATGSTKPSPNSMLRMK